MTPRFKLRKAQIEAMSKAAEPSFEDSVAAHIRQNHEATVAALDDAELKRRAKIGIVRARALGFETQDTITGYVALMFLVAPNFDEHPVASKILHDPSVPPEAKLPMLTDHMTADHWADARKMSNPKVWEAK